MWRNQLQSSHVERVVRLFKLVFPHKFNERRSNKTKIVRKTRIAPKIRSEVEHVVREFRVYAIILVISAILAALVMWFTHALGTEAGGGGYPLYVIGSTPDERVHLSLTEGDGLRGDIMQPTGVFTFGVNGLYGSYNPYRSLELKLFVDTAGPSEGNVLQAALAFDFEGDGIEDATVLYGALAVDNKLGPQELPGPQPANPTTPQFRDLENGTITVKVWNVTGVSPVTLWGSARSADSIPQSIIQIPYDNLRLATPTATSTSTVTPPTATSTPAPVFVIDPITATTTLYRSNAEYGMIRGKAFTLKSYGATMYSISDQGGPGFSLEGASGNITPGGEPREVGVAIQANMPDDTYVGHGVANYYHNGVWVQGPRITYVIILKSADPYATATPTVTSTPVPSATPTSTSTATAVSPTPTASPLACPFVPNTNLFAIVYGSVKIAGKEAPVGTIVEARNQRGNTAGCFQTTHIGSYGLFYVYGEQTVSGNFIPGMQNGETITFLVNGITADSTPSLTWRNDWSTNHWVELEVKSFITSTPTAMVSEVSTRTPMPMVTSTVIKTPTVASYPPPGGSSKVATATTTTYATPRQIFVPSAQMQRG